MCEGKRVGVERIGAPEGIGQEGWEGDGGCRCLVLAGAAGGVGGAEVSGQRQRAEMDEKARWRRSLGQAGQ